MSDNLYRLLIVLRQPQANIILTYSSKENAGDAFKDAQRAKATPFAAFEDVDDFGNTADVTGEQIAAVVLTDIDRDLEGNKQIALKQARAQAKANREAQADPMLGQSAQIMARPGQMPPGVPPFYRGN